MAVHTDQPAAPWTRGLATTNHRSYAAASHTQWTEQKKKASTSRKNLATSLHNTSLPVKHDVYALAIATPNTRERATHSDANGFDCGDHGLRQIKREVPIKKFSVVDGSLARRLYHLIRKWRFACAWVLLRARCKYQLLSRSLSRLGSSEQVRWGTIACECLRCHHRWPAAFCWVIPDSFPDLHVCVRSLSSAQVTDSSCRPGVSWDGRRSDRREVSASGSLSESCRLHCPQA